MANSGDSTDSQVKQSTQNGDNAELPETQGPAQSQGPDGSATQPGQSSASSSGGPKAKALVPPASDWPDRAPQVPGAEAGKKLLEPPFEPDKAKEGELLKGDYSPLGTAGAIGELVAVAAKDAAVAASTMLRPGDPVAAALVTAEALTAVLKTQVSTTHAPARGESSSSTPHSEKIAQDVIMSGILSERGDLGKWEKEKSTLYTNA